MNNTNAIHAEDLRKQFGHIQAVRRIRFDVHQGGIFSLLGPNGAGKSTTISMLACLLTPSSGDAQVMRHSIIHESMAVKRSIGVVPQEITLYAALTARENLNFWGKMYGLRGRALRQRVDEVLEIIGLADRQMSSSSIGRARRCCTPRTTWKKRRNFPTIWPSWIGARSSPTVHTTS